MGTLNATFTKWLVGHGPEMAGDVGGDGGDGAYAGKVLEMTPGTTTHLAPLSLPGLGAAIQRAGPSRANWSRCRDHGRRDRRLGQGQPVKGQYTEIQCEHDGVTTDCWRGSLAISEGASEGRPAAAAGASQ